MTLPNFRSVIGHAAFDLGLGQFPQFSTKAASLVAASTRAMPTMTATASATPQLTAGMCDATKQFIWRAATAAVPGHWERLRIGESCQGVSTIAPDVRTHEAGAGGGVTVSVVESLRTRKSEYEAKLRDFLQTQQTLNKQLVALMPECSTPLNLDQSPWATALISRGPAGKLGWANDLYHSPAETAAWAKDRSLKELAAAYNPAVWQRSPLPGVFLLFGVPFSISDRNQATYQRSFQPSDLQRWLIDYQIVLKSNSGDTIDDDTRKLKVSDALAKLTQKGLHYTTNLAGFTVNPFQPITANQTLDNYLNSGGYLIDVDMAQGKKPIGAFPNGRMSCTTFCRDPATGLPYCIDTLNLSGDLDTVSHWDVYAQIPVGALGANPTYTLTAKYKEYDPSWYETAINTVGGLMKKALDEICTPGTATNTYGKQAFATAAAKSSDPYVKAWAATGVYVMNKCSEAYTQQAPITQVPPTPPTPPDATDAGPSAPADVPAPIPPPISPIPAKYEGCVSRFHKTRGTFSVYCPVDWKPPAGLGADVSPAPPLSTIKVADLPVAPPEAPNVGTEDDPLFKKWQFWAILGGVVVAGGVGTYAAVRYRRRRQALGTRYRVTVRYRKFPTPTSLCVEAPNKDEAAALVSGGAKGVKIMRVARGCR